MRPGLVAFGNARFSARSRDGSVLAAQGWLAAVRGGRPGRVVGGDGGGECEEARADACSQAAQDAGAFEGEQ